MRPSDRSHAIELHENIAAITGWRDGLSERQRKRLIDAQANVQRWRTSTGHDNSKCPAELKADAMAAWKRFASCVQALPASEAAPLWQVVKAATDATRLLD